jgi:aminoglycoside phosphotransferase (APT) family kinase protein
VTGLGYPAPRPVLLEEGCGTFGGPFLVVERVPGPTLLRAMLGKPWLLFHFPAQMAAMQARLHALPPGDFPAPPGPFLERHLSETRAAIARHGLAGLLPGLDWLHARRPPEPASPSILHLDFHPLNLIERADGSLAVLDWTYSDRGDPHADVATTLLLLDCFPAAGRNLWERLSLGVGRPVVARRYHSAYARLQPLDEVQLAYYRAWSALRHLVRYGGWLRAGPEAAGCKCSLVEHAGPGLLTALCHYFRRWAGVEVSL